ncbi:sugar phosphate isomerase/epimerase [Microbacterium sp. X-17]|uniref:sugar phosphate isomerase/epimerase family protein n=1 Tax=Microbacterium sp. X-17 TaxID=3144404 RepID=UPI0031F592B8
MIDAAAASGFRHAGLRITALTEGDADVLSDAALMTAIADRLSDTGVQPLDLELLRIGPATVPSEAIPMLEFAQRIGAPHVTLASAETRWSDEDEALVCGHLERLGMLASSFGVRLSLEFMPYRAISSLAHAIRLVKAVDAEGVGLCVDALHLARSGGTPADVAAVDPGLLAVVQVCDAPAVSPAFDALPEEARYGRLLPGDGELPLAELVAAVPAEVPLSIEVPLRERAGASPTELARAAFASMQTLLGT